MNAAIRAGLAAKLTAGFPAWNVSAYFLGKVEPPQLDIMMPAGALLYDTAFQRGNDELECIVRASVQWGDAVSGQEMLDALLDTDRPSTSMKGVIEAEKTLGGTCDAVRVVQASELKVFPLAGTDVIGVEFTVAITPTGP